MNLEQAIAAIYGHRSRRVLLHVLFWLLMAGSQWYITSISFNPARALPAGAQAVLTGTQVAGTLLFYYALVYFVLPRFFYRKRWLAGTAAFLLLVGLYALADTVREGAVFSRCGSCAAALKASNPSYFAFLKQSFPGRWLAKLVSLGSLIGMLSALALPLCLKFGMQALRSRFTALQLARENLQLEFDFLKAQVNPHFLFNSLNNIYGLILTDQKERSADLVARLAQLLRYTLYETSSDLMPVAREVQVLQDYIDLESVRLNHTTVQFTHSNDGTVGSLAPLLMMPVVENAFKHSADHQDAEIRIHLAIQDRQVAFESRNRVDPDRPPGMVGGIGLKNLQKRLDLYYPGRYRYQALHREQEYIVAINIDCHA